MPYHKEYEFCAFWFNTLSVTVQNLKRPRNLLKANLCESLLFLVIFIPKCFWYKQINWISSLIMTVFLPSFWPPTDLLHFSCSPPFLRCFYPSLLQKNPYISKRIFTNPTSLPLCMPSFIPPSSLSLSPTLLRSQISDYACVRSIQSMRWPFVEEFLQTSSSRWRGSLNCSAERTCCSAHGIWALLSVISSSQNLPT